MKRTSKEIENKVVEMYKSGLSYRKISEITDIKLHVIRKIVKQSDTIVSTPGFKKKYNYDEIINIYKNGKTIKEVSIATGASFSCVTNILKSKNVPLRRKVNFNKDDIVNLYLSGHSIKFISQKLKLPKTNIARRVKRYGISRSISQAKRNEQINHKCFKEYNINSAYWAGFLAADGSIRKKGGVRLALQKRDIGHLKKFGEFINYNKIKLYSNTPEIVFGSKEIEKDLDFNFNIINNKVYILNPPSQINKNFISHFIRGYLDGDGCIHKTKCKISFAGTYMMLCWIKENIKLFVEEAKNPSVLPQKQSKYTYTLTFNGKIQSRKIVKWLYEGSTENTRLDRKYEIAKNYM